MIELFAICAVVLLGLAPLLLSIWGIHSLARHPHLYIHRHRDSAYPIHSAHRSFPQRGLVTPRRLSWFEPMGYVGDTSCQFNAQSPLIRCAVNPSGPCQGCAYYETRSHLTQT